MDIFRQMSALNQMDTITLAEMNDIKLMNRIDTKYIANIDYLPILLEKAKSKYRVQVVKDSPIAAYRTLYYDTQDAEMYTLHHNKKLQRQKIRTRTYLDSQISFLEIKDKTNKGRTNKERIQIDPNDYSDFSRNEKAVNFLNKNSQYPLKKLLPQIENSFDRITLVNEEKTERLTLDFNFCFRNFQTGVEKELSKMIIIELKQDGRCESMFKNYLSELRIRPISISKKCYKLIFLNTIRLLHSNLIQLHQILNLWVFH